MRDIQFHCKHCKQSLEAPGDMHGTTIRCPTCTKPIRVPRNALHVYAIGGGIYAGVTVLWLWFVGVPHFIYCLHPDCFYSFPYDAIVAVISSIAVIVSLYLPRARYLPAGLRKRSLLVCFAVLPIAVIIIAISSRDAFVRLHRNVIHRWLVLTEPNIINRDARENIRNLSIDLPVSNEGGILTEGKDADLYVELDHAGLISINNARINYSMLTDVLSNRVVRVGTYRVFIWADKGASPANRVRLIQTLRSAGSMPLYFVVASSDERKDRIEYRAVPVPEEDLNGEPPVTTNRLTIPSLVTVTRGGPIRPDKGRAFYP
jgi:biopolymer transport protein ExbD